MECDTIERRVAMKLRYTVSLFMVMGVLTYGRTPIISLCRENGTIGHLCYMFCHSSLLHYLLNGISWCVMWNNVTVARTLWAWLMAVVVGYVLPYGTPVCGWSVILYFYLGMMMRLMASDVRLRLLALTLIGLLIPGIAVWHHVMMMVCGYVGEWCRRRWAI